MNRAFLYGNLGAKPEVKYTQNAKKVVSFSLATRESADYTEWHNIQCWDKTADLAEQYLDKGAAVIVEGKIRSSSWEDKNGNKRKRTFIVANRITFTKSPEKIDQPKLSMDDEIPF